MEEQKYSSKPKTIPEMVSLMIALKQAEGFTRSKRLDKQTTVRIILIS